MIDEEVNIIKAVYDHTGTIPVERQMVVAIIEKISEAKTVQIFTLSV